MKNIATEQSNNEPTFELEVTLHAVEDLGVRLYSSLPAVLSETVANAYDADANEIYLDIKKEDDEIIIYDNGCGMSVNDLNKRFLQVGYKKREELGTDISPSGRKFMGRKGIGKLSLFAIANNVIVISKTYDKQPSGFKMIFSDIQEKAKNKQKYYPQELTTQDIDNLPSIKGYNELSNGTYILLTQLTKKRISTDNLRQKLARRFACLGSEFNLYIDNKPLTFADRNYSDTLEYLWKIGATESEIYTQNTKGSKLDKIFNDTHENYKFYGWIGTRKKHISNDEENSVALIINGRVAVANILKIPTVNQIGVDYMIGEIHADYLDKDDEDIVISNRQGIIEDDQDYASLMADFTKIIKEIASQWSDLRAKEGVKTLQELIPSVGDWYDKLEPNTKRVADKLFGKVNTLKTNDSSHKIELFKASYLQ